MPHHRDLPPVYEASSKHEHDEAPARENRGFFYSAAIGGRGGARASRGLVPKEREQEDDRNWDAEHPKKNASTHFRLLLSFRSVNADSKRQFPTK
jgi:hypothetical protein